MKYILILLLLCSTLFGDDTNSTTIVQDIKNIVFSPTTADDQNISKIDKIKNYFHNITFKDQLDTKRYKFNLMSHRENYMLLCGYSPTTIYQKYWVDGIEDKSKEYKRHSNEAQFQLSIKLPLFSNFLNTNADLFAAYTQNSYWQVYDTDHSSPFRETNYMPELFLQWNIDKKIGNSKLLHTRLAVIHQSNGKEVGASRSWNRTEISMLLKKDNYFYGFSFWNRWDEKPKTDITQTSGDDNPDLIDKIGRERFFIKYRYKRYNISIAHQNDIFDYHLKKGNTKLDIIFPSLNNNFNLFIRYFSGYGESLIDYDIAIDRVSFGMIITDWI